MSHPPESEPSIDRSLVRLLLANRVRELADYPRAVTVNDLGGRFWLFAGIARLAYGTAEFFSKAKPGWKRLLFVPLDSITLIIVRLMLHNLMIWKTAADTVKTVVRNSISSSTRYHARPTSMVTDNAAPTEMEEPLIRICLMLRVIRRYGACIELLIQRLRSGLPAEETRRWLSFFLSEIQDQEAAGLISSANGRPDAVNHVPSYNGSKPKPLNGETRSALKYGVVLPTMFDSDVFRQSLLSLLNSDFAGEIVVVEEGNNEEKVSQSFCSQLPVKYIKNPTWTGTSGVANLGINQMAPDTDVIIFAHSDLLWPKRWFDQYDRAWSSVSALDKVGIIYLGVLEFYRTSDPVLSDMFVQGEYADLAWVLGAMLDVPNLMGSIGNVQMNDRDRGYLFGLSVSHWDRGIPSFKIGSPAVVTFLRSTWAQLGEFDLEMGDGVWPELVYQNILDRKWGLQINNIPLIHHTRSDLDMSRATLKEGTTVNQIVRRNMGRFKEMYGLDYRVLSQTYHDETLSIHSGEITSAVNELRFSDIDYIFDEFNERLNRKTASDLELAASPSYPNN